MKKSAATKSTKREKSAPASAREVGFPIVGIGASAGGFEAFLLLLKHLPADTGMAFVFVQHLDPTHESKLSELLARNSRMPVSEINDATALAPNHVYVIPPNRSLTLSCGVLHLHPRTRSKGVPMPIDVFFRSLARDLGNHAIGIILSGNGADGTLGLKEIKAEGGITMAQDERSAKYPSMPRSAIASGAVDYALPPDLIARELKRIAGIPSLMRLKTREAEPVLPDSANDFAKIFSLVFSFTGVDFTHYKQSTLKRRILRRMVIKRMDNLRQYVAYLQEHPTEIEALFQDMLINVTSFFRDPEVFVALRKKILPRILKRLHPGGVIRVWVPGCSTGEEVYSIAICLHEALSKTAKSVSMQVFATDISDLAISRARVGIYTDAITLHVSPERLHRYFVRSDQGYQIAKFIRDACIFARQNVVEDPPFSKMDLISCRNVLIYLGPPLQRKIVPLFHYALQPGGFLMLGTSETIGQFSELFALADKKNKIYSKIGASSRQQIAFAPKPLDDVIESRPKGQTKREEQSLPELHKHVDHVLLSRYVPSGVVIHSAMEVLQFRGQTGLYLEHAAGEASLHLLKMAREPLIVDLRATIMKAMKTNEPVRKDGLRVKHNGHWREVAIEVAPFRMPNVHERFYLVLFHDFGLTEEEGKGKGARARSGRRSEVESREVRRLRDEIEATKESLQSIIEEQETTNEELKSANEEIQSSNEELQSTNEELETAKEELQSTNEELTTLNEELQNRNYELTQANNDLSNLLSSVNLAILMLGNDLTIRRFTPLAEKFFNLIPSDVGRRITDINPNLLFKDIDKAVSEVIATLNTQEYEVQDRQGHWYSMRIRPYRTSDQKIDGAVIVLVDIHETKQAVEQVAGIVDQPLLLLRDDFRVLSANDAYCRWFKTTKHESEGASFLELADGSWKNPALRSRLEDVLNTTTTLENFALETNLGPAKRKLLISAYSLPRQSKTLRSLIVTFREAP